MDDEKVALVEEEVKALNSRAKLLKCSWGKVPLNDIFIKTGMWAATSTLESEHRQAVKEAEAKPEAAAKEAEHEHGHHHEHGHEEHGHNEAECMEHDHGHGGKFAMNLFVS